MGDKLVLKYNRRDFGKKSTKLFATVAGVAVAPTIFARKKYHLRVLGTHVTMQEEIREQAEKDLGISISFSAGGSARVLHKASTDPQSFDLYEQWSNSINVLWQANAIQPIDISRIRYWDDVNQLAKLGRLTNDAKLGAGDAPYKILYVQKDQTLSSNQTRHISFLPYVHNTDSYAYKPDAVGEGRAYTTESWGWLLDPKHRGRVALVNAPSIGIFDAALAAQANGLIQFENIGDMKRTEIDRLFQILIDFKRQGHFRGVWSSVPQSVEFMEQGEVDIQSMFSPGVASLNSKGIRCVYAAPKEGYRAWHGVMCLSSKVDSQTKDAAYEYMNWWLSGWAGAFIARQGYYISTPALSRKILSPDEWDYWYEGKAAARDLLETNGKVSIKAGVKRNGGSYTKRFGNVAVWNTVMSNYEYTLTKWSEFLLT